MTAVAVSAPMAVTVVLAVMSWVALIGAISTKAAAAIGGGAADGANSSSRGSSLPGADAAGAALMPN